MSIERSRIIEIEKLHNEISGLLKMSLQKAIRIGQLLVEQKASLQHGRFSHWIKSNLPFTDRTARNYMNIYRNKDFLKAENVSDLAGAYKLLESKNQTWHEWVQEQKCELRAALDNSSDISELKLIYDKVLWLTQASAEILLYAEVACGRILAGMVEYKS